MAATVTTLHPAKQERTISVVHRIKKTADGEERPTLVAIKEPDGNFNRFELDTEREELDFITATGKYKDFGLRAGDFVITPLGGSGDNMSFAMSRALREVGGELHRAPYNCLKEFKDTPAFQEIEKKMRDDVMLLHILLDCMPENFFECRIRDRETIRISELYRVFKDAQLERMKCANRLRARTNGQIFLSEDGKYPEGKTKDWYAAKKAADPIYKAIEQEEENAIKELDRAITGSRINDVFSGIVGCGPSITGGIISAIGDIRRFSNPAKLTSYLLGLNKRYNETGQFPRSRRGVNSGFSEEKRQPFYQLADQFNRRPESEWGQKLLANKVYYRTRRPDVIFAERMEKDGKQVDTGRYFTLITKIEIVVVDGEPKEKKTYWYEHPQTGESTKVAEKTLSFVDESGAKVKVKGSLRYYDGHIHRMAIWKTLREFIHEKIFPRWTNLDKTEYVPVEKSMRKKKAA